MNSTVITIEYSTISYPSRWTRAEVTEYSRRAYGLELVYAGRTERERIPNIVSVREVKDDTRTDG